MSHLVLNALICTREKIETKLLDYFITFQTALTSNNWIGFLVLVQRIFPVHMYMKLNCDVFYKNIQKKNSIYSCAVSLNKLNLKIPIGLTVNRFNSPQIASHPDYRSIDMIIIYCDKMCVSETLQCSGRKNMKMQEVIQMSNLG